MATQEIAFEEEDGRFRDIQTGLRSISTSSMGSVHSTGSASGKWNVCQLRQEKASELMASVLSCLVDQAPGRASGSEMDEQRKRQMAYEYLCHLEETKV